MRVYSALGLFSGGIVRVAIAGGTGMVGTWLAEHLRARGDDVCILTRGRPRAADHLQWSTSRGVSDPARLEGLDGFVNLTGAPIADRPWTKARRQILWESRVDATQTLIESLERLERPPVAYVGAGGLGIFGDRGDEVLDESSAIGTGFLAELSQGWELAHASANRLGCRTSTLRMSVVLSPTGGVFPLMVRPFRFGIGGWLGNGRQYTSWISIRDAVGAIVHLLERPECAGPFNGTVPVPPRNKEWLKALGLALHRPVLTHAPKWALRGALGELADDLLIASVRAVPKKLLDTGYSFRDAESEPTFRWLLEELDERNRG